MNIQKAVCITQSWLSSWGVHSERKESQLFVEGHTLDFGAGTGIRVNVEAVLSQDFTLCVSEMKRLATLIGRVALNPSRTPPTKRVRGEDLLARSLRLTAFAKAPNPPAELMKKYEPIVKREADRAHRRFISTTREMLLEPSDYLCIGMVFLTVYLHRYQDLEHESRNRANLTLYLQQEFAHFDRVLHHDFDSLVFDPRGFLVEQFVQAPIPGATVEWWDTWANDTSRSVSSREPSYTPSEYATPEPPEPPVVEERNLPHHLLSDLLTAKEFTIHARKCPSCGAERKAKRLAHVKARKAKAVLKERLEALPHNAFVEALASVIDSPFYDPEARELATALFRKHMRHCEPCYAAWHAWEEYYAQTRKYQPYQPMY